MARQRQEHAQRSWVHRLEDMAVDVIGRFYSASAAGQDALASTSVGLYSDDSVRAAPLNHAGADQQPLTMSSLALSDLAQSHAHSAHKGTDQLAVHAAESFTA